MQDVPKIVRQQLKASKPSTAELHPDADILTAFAERALAGVERDTVVDHLARCADCRDIVALALPAMEDAAVPAMSGTRIDWFSLPVLRWGAVAAVLLAVASVGIHQYQRSHQEQIVASNFVQKKGPTDAPTQNIQALSQAPLTKVAPKPPVPEIQMPKEAMATLPAQTTVAGGSASAGRNFTQLLPLQAAKGARAASPSSHRAFGGAAGGIGSGFAPSQDSAPAKASASPAPVIAPQQNPTAAQAQGVLAPSSSEVVEVQSEAAQGTSQTAQNQVQDRLIQNRKELPLNGRNVTNLDAVAKAKDPVPAPGIPPQSSAVMAGGAPRWTISSLGTLQRSFDDGKTWQEINPSAASVASSSVTESTAATDLYVTNQSVDVQSLPKPAKKNQKAKASPNPMPVFRAVAASGLEIWAGGSSGMLYHAIDGGNRWTLVLPSASGTILTGDITGIQFPDPQHGTVATSNAEIWTTADNGQTWQRQ